MAIQSIKKTFVGTTDIAWDTDGSGKSFLQETSDGENRINDKVNAEKMPVTSTLRALNHANGASTYGEAGNTNVDKVLQQMAASLVALGVPDGTILAVTSGVLAIQNASITNAKMAANSIDSDQYVDDSIDTAHISEKAVTGTELANDASVDANRAVNSNHLKDGAVIKRTIADNAVDIDSLDLDGSGDTLKFYTIDGGIEGSVTGATHTINTTRTDLATGTDIAQVTIKAQSGTVTLLKAEINSTSSILCTFSTSIAAGALYWKIERPASV